MFIAFAKQALELLFPISGIEHYVGYYSGLSR